MPPPPSAQPGERGAALAIALFALTLLGAVVVAAFFAGTQEQRMAESARFAQQAFGRAEMGLADVLDSLGGGAGRSSHGVSAVQVHRLDESIYLIDVTAQDKAGWGRRRLGLLARVRPPALALHATLTTQGAVDLRDGARLDGTDAGPPGWADCSPPDTNLPAVRSTPTPMELDYEDLASRANHVLPGGRYLPEPAIRWDGACDSLVSTNWGDGVAITGPCAAYSPVVHVLGDLELVGGRGQGVLFVDGDLTIAGPFEFFGLIVVRGRIGTPATGVDGARLWGAAIVGNPTAGDQLLAGDLAMHQSNCAIAKALRSMARPVPLRSRSWIQLF